MIDSPPPPSRLLRAYAAVVRWLLWVVLAVWTAFTLLWGTLHGWIVPRIEDFRPQLEIQASRALGVPVRIGGITAHTEGLVPSFEITDLLLLDPQGREALRLHRVVASLSPRSMLNFGFDQLYIEQPALDVRRAQDGRIFVAGLDMSRGESSDGRAADWFFNQTEFVIRNGTLQWTDELRGATPLALSSVDLVVRNPARRHLIRLDATPPSGLGQRFKVQGVFRQPLLSRNPGQWTEWDGQIHADFPRVDAALLRHLGDLGVEVREGQGALRLWADVNKGEVSGAVADVLMTGVSAVLGRQLAPLDLDTVSGRLGGRRLAHGFDFSTRDLQFRTREGQVWPGGNVALTWTGAEGKMPAQGDVRADRLDLAALAQLGSRLPLGSATHVALAAYAPKGLVESLHARWQGPIAAPEKYQAKGRASGLEVAARPASPATRAAAASTPVFGSPGIRGAAIDFDVNQSGGKARLVVQAGSLELPGFWEEPVVPLDSLSTDVQWQRTGSQLSITVNELKFSNADGEGQAQATWRTSDPARSRSRSQFPGVLDLQASLSRMEGTRVHRYLPQTIAKSARDYVREAITQGTATGVKMRIKGDLWEVPARDPRQGEFRISANVRDVSYAYVPRSLLPKGQAPWPALSGVSGELVFDRNSMELRAATGRIAGSPALQIARADARIADLTQATTVVVSGLVRGPLADALQVVNSSPLATLTGQVLERTTANGLADVRLALNIPVLATERTRVQGTVSLAGNDLQITPDSPTLLRARGNVLFSESGLTLSGAQARMYGGDVRLEGGTRVLPPGSLEPLFSLRAQGTFTAEALRQARELGQVTRLAQTMQGSASYTATLAFRRGVPEIALTSNLQGLALNLPPPLNKPADAVLPLRFENTLLRESHAPGTRLQDQLIVELGRLASVHYVRDIASSPARILRGSIGAGLGSLDAAPVADQGVVVNINLGRVDLDAWEQALAGITGAPLVASGVSGSTATQVTQGYLPTVMAIRANELVVDGRTLHNIVVGGARDGQLWRANLDARELNGYVEYRQPSGAGPGRLYARLARLSLAAGEASDVERLLNEPPSAIPALDVVIDDLELRGRKMGRVEVDAVNRGGAAIAREGGVREWRLNRLNLTLPEATLSATGNWAALNARALPPGSTPPPHRESETRRTVLNFKLDIADSGRLLARYGMHDVIRNGKGRMEGQVAWLGSPLAIDYASMTGAFNVNIESGQFLKADPGIAKLLGVLSLQSLPRRLVLDFRDVFSEGFAFDFVRGDVSIQQGIASTSNLQMKGVNAAVLMEGTADIARETQDIKVLVVPEINAGTASLVASVLNPVVGIGTFLAQLFLRNPLVRANTQEFHIDGTWADPRITKVENRTDTPPARAAPQR